MHRARPRSHITLAATALTVATLLSGCTNSGRNVAEGAVAPAQRGCGLGSALAAAAEQRAIEAGARTLLLLTESAVALARARGFTAVSRCALAPGVFVFRQFSAGCCAGATCFIKQVEPETKDRT